MPEEHSQESCRPLLALRLRSPSYARPMPRMRCDSPTDDLTEGDTTLYIKGRVPFSYSWNTGTNVMASKTTTLPVISTGQNGSGSTVTTVEEYDTQGNLTQFTDERGTVNTFAYEAGILGAVSEQALDTGGLNLVTDFTYDDQGRLLTATGPEHTVVLSGTATSVQPVTWMVYNQSTQPGSGTWGPDSTWTGTGYLNVSTSAYALVNPVSINNLDKDGRSTDQITSVRTTGSGALSPTDTFSQTDWQSWSSTQYDNQHRTISSRVYFLIPSSGTGTEGTNFAETDFGYDALERLNRVDSPVGTITRTVWTTPQWVLSTWVGTDDTGATDSNPAGSGSPNNMVQITANVYDGGSAGGDGNLTQVTQFVSATSGDTRVTSYGYDFRDRRTSMTDATNRLTVFTYDNLDRQTQVQSYATSGGTLFAQSQFNFDDRSRLYQILKYAVDPSVTSANAILVDGVSYSLIGPTDVPPDTTEIDGECSDCDTDPCSDCPCLDGAIASAVSIAAGFICSDEGGGTSNKYTWESYDVMLTGGP